VLKWRFYPHKLSSYFFCDFRRFSAFLYNTQTVPKKAEIGDFSLSAWINKDAHAPKYAFHCGFQTHQIAFCSQATTHGALPLSGLQGEQAYLMFFR
jgi:hypothetical protein